MLAATLVVGAAVQGLVGLGVGLVSAPVVTLLEPDLMPGMLLFMGFFTPAFTLVAGPQRHRLARAWPGRCRCGCRGR